jgi:hypothetical protein
MAASIKQCTLDLLDSMGGFFAKDLELLSEQQVMTSPGGAARRPIDYVHEVTVVNRGIACQLRGEDPNPLFGEQSHDENKFIVAPTKLTKSEAVAAFKQSITEVREIVDGMSEEDMLTPRQSFFGEKPAYWVAQFVAIHTNYHNGQLNLVQGLGGDGKNNWF